MKVLDLFSAAAGGWSLGMHRAGFATMAACVAGTRVAVGGPRGTSAASLIVEAYGDAVVPQIPEAIGRAIMRVECAMAAILRPYLFAGRG